MNAYSRMGRVAARPARSAPRGVARWPLLLLAISLGTACARKGGGEADDEGKSGGGGESTPAAVAVRIATVGTQPFTETIGAIGTVAPRAGHLATLGAPAPARIARVLVATGQHVVAGQALVELEAAPFTAAAQSAEAAANAAQRAYDRTERLAQEGIAPRKDVEAAAADLAHARIELVTARRNAQLATLRAPIGGVVTRMSATLGAAADVSQPLVEIADPSALDIVLNATPTDAGRIHPGARVALSAGQSATGEPLGTGTVVDVGGTVDTASRGVAVRVQAPTTRRPLRIGETVFGRIAVSVRPDAVVVPLEALVPDGEGFKVFVVDAGGRAHARPVTVGGQTDQGAEITQGLVAGERIVTYGAYGMEDSAKVVPLSNANAPAGGKP